MSKVEVIVPGMLTTLQDAGRFNYQHIGMPVGGAMDLYSLELANYLVGNNPFEGCLETTFTGPEFLFHDSCFIAVTGAIAEVTLNGTGVPMYTLIKAKQGDVLSVGQAIYGVRSYIAFGGGIGVPLVMGSKSTFLRGKMGGIQGRALKSGDVLDIGQPNPINEREIPESMIPLFENEFTARIIPGPEAKEISMEGLRNFLSGEFVLTGDCDRMGYRLSGPLIAHLTDANIISSGVTFGTIQVPKHGSPIILMADRQTMGGYTRIANVISVDHSQLGQLKPGDKVNFKEVGLQEAGNLYREKEQSLNKLFSYNN